MNNDKKLMSKGYFFFPVLAALFLSFAGPWMVLITVYKELVLDGYTPGVEYVFTIIFGLVFIMSIIASLLYPVAIFTIWNLIRKGELRLGFIGVIIGILVWVVALPLAIPLGLTVTIKNMIK